MTNAVNDLLMNTAAYQKRSNDSAGLNSSNQFKKKVKVLKKKKNFKAKFFHLHLCLQTRNEPAVTTASPLQSFKNQSGKYEKSIKMAKPASSVLDVIHKFSKQDGQVVGSTTIVAKTKDGSLESARNNPESATEQTIEVK